ncbi:ribosome biogenesis GTPase A [Clostridium collagenovorans DSM 3089]|uniref:Ribosome biogenesis GTPase A n=1 Tax=Clostridium collagenovorans DSM 3089 TaxID=1121306 RepID=A0A1M5SUJ8_9CLOT|nr:ribosome biogenesis GTPase YlqF [Clostridium collagenovorans]SHH42157.1 ribosome biogenesis GTPase A [Clostridium collagenovorans DSM 3089]
MAINWYPGHMAKTRRQITENLKLVDAVIEIRDARIVKSSANPDIEKICKDKPRIVLLNKFDLSDPVVTNAWIKKLEKKNVRVILTNSLLGKGLNQIKPTLDELFKEKKERLKNKGVMDLTIRVMVVGIPNVGKSSFINKMAKNKIAKVGDRPGVTRNNQWIKTKVGIEMLDTPGVLWPKFEDEETALNLAFTGAIKDEIMDIEELAYKLVEKLTQYYPERLKERYKLTELSEDPLENLDMIGKKRGMVISGGNIDYNRLAVMLLDEFRGGKLGGISMDR